MTVAGLTTARATAPAGRLWGGFWCGQKCGRMCGLGVHTWGGPRPRQHWVFTCAPSPTTRPPRSTEVGWVRVVGLGAVFGWLEAGAGLISGAVQGLDEKQRLDEKKGDSEKKKDRNINYEEGVMGPAVVWAAACLWRVTGELGVVG